MKVGLYSNIISINFKFHWNYDDLIINRYIIVSLGAIAAIVSKLSFDWLKNKRRIDQLERENTQAELHLLKAQINPHFLFNALNSIYVLMDFSQPEAKNLLHGFSQLLRYQLYECNADRVLLIKEIENLENFISLQQKRNEDNIILEKHIVVRNRTLLIAPLVLIAFVENAFKHISNINEKPGLIRISVATINEELKFQVFSTTGQKSENYIDEKVGIGIENIKRRLSLLYPELHSLIIKHEETSYYVELNIKLDED